jgi:hypothetical protein
MQRNQTISEFTSFPGTLLLTLPTIEYGQVVVANVKRIGSRSYFTTFDKSYVLNHDTNTLICISSNLYDPNTGWYINVVVDDSVKDGSNEIKYFLHRVSSAVNGANKLTAVSECYGQISCLGSKNEIIYVTSLAVSSSSLILTYANSLSSYNQTVYTSKMSLPAAASNADASNSASNSVLQCKLVSSKSQSPSGSIISCDGFKMAKPPRTIVKSDVAISAVFDWLDKLGVVTASGVKIDDAVVFTCDSAVQQVTVVEGGLWVITPNAVNFVGNESGKWATSYTSRTDAVRQSFVLHSTTLITLSCKGCLSYHRTNGDNGRIASLRDDEVVGFMNEEMLAVQSNGVWKVRVGGLLEVWADNDDTSEENVKKIKKYGVYNPTSTDVNGTNGFGCAGYGITNKLLQRCGDSVRGAVLDYSDDKGNILRHIDRKYYEGVKEYDGEKVMHVNESKGSADLQTVAEYFGKNTINVIEEEESVAGVISLADILAKAAAEKEGVDEERDSEDSGVKKWLKSVSSRKADECLSGYYRFTSVQANWGVQDISPCGTVGKLEVDGATEVSSNSVADEGPSHATLHDVVKSRFYVECQRGDCIDTGAYHYENEGRDKLTVEVWCKLEEKGVVFERYVSEEGVDAYDAKDKGKFIYGVEASEENITFKSGDNSVVASLEEGVVTYGKWFHLAIKMVCVSEREVKVDIYVKAKNIGGGVIELPGYELQKTSDDPRLSLDKFVCIIGSNKCSFTDLRFWSSSRTDSEIDEFMSEVLKQAESKRRKFTVKISNDVSKGETREKRTPSLMKLGGPGIGAIGGPGDKRRSRASTAGSTGSIGSPPKALLRKGALEPKHLDALEEADENGSSRSLAVGPIASPPASPPKPLLRKGGLAPPSSSPRASPKPLLRKPMQVEPKGETPSVTTAAAADVRTLPSRLDAESFAQHLGNAATKVLLVQKLPQNDLPFVICGGGKTLIVSKDGPKPLILPIAGTSGWASSPSNGKQFLLSCSATKMVVFEIFSKARIGEVPLTKPLSFGRYIDNGVFLVVNQVGGFLFGVGYVRPIRLFKKVSEQENVLQVDVAEDLESGVVKTEGGGWYYATRGADKVAIAEFGVASVGRYVSGVFYVYDDSKLSAWKRSSDGRWSEVASVAVEGGCSAMDVAATESGSVFVAVMSGGAGSVAKLGPGASMELVGRFKMDSAGEGLCVRRKDPSSVEVVGWTGGGESRYWRSDVI